MIQCGFISNNKLNEKFKLEFTLGLPMVTLLWNILCKINKKMSPVKVKKKDIFNLMAAILGYQASGLISDEDSYRPTANPLLSKNGHDEIVFKSRVDLNKFAERFINFKNNYNDNGNLRLEYQNKLKTNFLE